MISKAVAKKSGGILYDDVKPVFPDDIREHLESVKEETRDKIRVLFNEEIKGIVNCGELIFEWTSFEHLQ